ncbi:hypothetical protein DYB28_004936 [Aphanomyces astaci]|uniref:Uncharacterized protein n=1 Tax=Aphanomyces astaci TaxID=112090 RepID=A0A9X8HGC4_APHAT|nr:hypothetical protein DYB28_004936 [Aphanomyces astaci]
MADPRARNLAKEWLTQQMYHNMHEPLALLPAMSYDDEDCFHIDVRMSDDVDPFRRLGTTQYMCPGTVHMFRRLVESNMQSVVEECTGNTRLLHTTTSKGIFVNSLQGHFIEADRFIMVMRQVEHDEVHVCHPQHKQRHLRTEVRQVSPSHISVRVVSHASHLFRPATGFLSVDELAALRGIDVTDVDDGLKDEYVRRQLIQREYAEFLPWRQRLIDLMHRHSTTT